MTLTELKQQINNENLNSSILYIHDSRVRRFIEETRPAYEVIINIKSDDNYQLFVYNARGYKCIERNNLTESQACECALITIREHTKILDEIYKDMTSGSKNKSL